MSVDDADFDPAIGHNIVVLLDGKVVEMVIGYDVPGGTVTRAARDFRGRTIVERDEIKFETLTGVITARWADGGDQPVGPARPDPIQG